MCVQPHQVVRTTWIDIDQCKLGFRLLMSPEAVEKKFGFEGVPNYVLWNDGKIVLRTSEITKLEDKLKELLAAKKEDK